MTSVTLNERAIKLLTAIEKLDQAYEKDHRPGSKTHWTPIQANSVFMQREEWKTELAEIVIKLYGEQHVRPERKTSKRR